MILLSTSAQNQIKKSRNEAESHPMRMMWTVAILLAAWAFGAQTASAQGKKIDLRTKDGVATVKGQWKYHDVKIVEVDGKGPDGKPNKTYNIEPKAEAKDFDDSQWETIAPETLKDRRAGGQVCFCWYRIKITLPSEVAGKAVFFQTTVDDYGEVWVNGRLPRTPGQTGEAIVSGFNTPNRVELKDPQPGKVYQIAVFGINGPISASPSNWIFLGDTFLDITTKK
jgi:gluconolactonase